MLPGLIRRWIVTRLLPLFFPRLRVALAALVLVAGPAERAMAVPLSWRTATSGNAGVAGNWTPSQVPAPADVLTFNVGGTYTVTFDGTVPSVTSHIYRSGTVTIVTSGHATSSTARVGDVNGDVGIARLTTGTLTVNNNFLVGNQAGSTGTLRVDDDDADLFQPGTTSDVYVGAQGTGTLEITGGGLVDAADDVLIGMAPGTQGTVLVSGVNASPLVRSTLTSSGTDGDIVVANNGTAFLTVAAGGQVVAADDLPVGLLTGSQGTVTVEGNTGATNSSLAVTDDLFLADNGVVPTSGGTASMLVQNGGLVTVGGTTRLGDPDGGGTGSLRLRPGGSFTTHDLIAHPTRGVIDFQGGNLIVDGGVFDPPTNSFLLDDDQFERLTLRNAATATFDGSSLGYALVVGETEDGGLDLQSGAHVTQAQGVLALAVAPGSVGVLNMSGAALLDGTGSLVVGQGGFGELNLGGGADVDLDEMYVAFFPGSNGFVDVAGPGTTLTLEKLGIGGSMSTPGGQAFVGVSSGAVVQMGDETTPIRVHDGSTLRVGGTLNAGNIMNVSGRVDLAGGVVNAGLFALQPGGELEGFGTIAGNVAASNSDFVIRSAGGALLLGSTTSNKGFESGGTLICGSGAAVTIRDSDGSSLGNVVLEAGQLFMSTPFGTVQTGKTMSGTGLVQGHLRIAGTLSPGASAGLITSMGSFTMLAGGKMAMEIGDAATTQHDRLHSGTSVTLAGTLDIRLLPGFTPSPNELFTLITCGSRSGTFSAVTFYGQPLNGQFTLVYNPSSVQLRVNDVTTAVPSPGEFPQELAFAAAGTGFELALPEAMRVIVRLYDARGRAVATLCDGDAGPGVLTLPIEARGRKLADGVYFGRAMVRRQGFERVLTAKAVLVR
jgi:T5SS/PEP-CTERM-associated repeat protein